MWGIQGRSWVVWCQVVSVIPTVDATATGSSLQRKAEGRHNRIDAQEKSSELVVWAIVKVSNRKIPHHRAQGVPRRMPL